jgi:ribosomal protein S27E
VNTNDSIDARRLDGNVLGGPLGDLFAPDVTMAAVTCAHCGRVTPLAAHQVYADAPAFVVRCPGCTDVVMRCASDERGVRFEMTGVRMLVIAHQTEDSG